MSEDRNVPAVFGAVSDQGVRYTYKTYGLSEYWDAKTGKPILPGTPEYEAIDREVKKALAWSMRPMEPAK